MAKFGVAQPVRRVEDPRLLLGKGRYTDDIALPNALVGVVLRSPHAAARITSLETAEAKAVEGVVAVYTSADLKADGIGNLPCGIPLKNRDGSDRADPPHPVLADGAVRHVGDPVAFIVAETHQAARDAAELIMVDYDVLPSCTDLGRRDGARLAAGLAGREEQRRFRLGSRRQGQDRGAVRSRPPTSRASPW